MLILYSITRMEKNLNNYIDVAHYHEDVNSYMIECMANDIGLLTYENYENYLNEKTREKQYCMLKYHLSSYTKNKITSIEY